MFLIVIILNAIFTIKGKKAINMKNKSNLKKAVMLASVVIFGTISISAAVQASTLPTVEQSKPSGIIITPFSVFDPTFKSLENGSAIISNKKDGNITISVETNAKSKVSTVGLSFVLQRWDGSVWIDVYSSGASTKSNASYLIATNDRKVSTGYYYRVKSKHWTIKDGVKEQGERVTNSYLVN